MIIACPNCYLQIIPMADHRCPSCLQDTRNVRKAAVTQVQLKPDYVLPSVCVVCGSEATSRVAVDEQHTVGGESLFVRLLVLLFRPWTYFARREQIAGKKIELSIKLPLCDACKQAGDSLRPQYVNFAQGTFTFLVHDNFAAAFTGEPIAVVPAADRGYREPPERTS